MKKGIVIWLSGLMLCLVLLFSNTSKCQEELPDLTLTPDDINSGLDRTIPDIIIWPVYYNITIKNQGNIVATNIDVHIFVGNPDWDWIFVDKYDIDEILYGTDHNDNITRTSGIDTSCAYVRVVIDPYNNITESNENNNIAIYRRTTGHSPSTIDLPNLQFHNETSIYILNNETTIVEGKSVEIFVDLNNYAMPFADAVNVSVSFYIDDELLDVKIIDYFMSNTERQTVTTVWVPTVGNHTIKVIIDENNTVEERFENNNQDSIYIQARSKTFLEAHGFILGSTGIIILIIISTISILHLKRRHTPPPKEP